MGEAAPRVPLYNMAQGRHRPRGCGAAGLSCRGGMRETGKWGDAAPHLLRAREAAAAPSRCRSGLVPAPTPRGVSAPAGIPAARTGAGEGHFHSLHSGRISGIPPGSVTGTDLLVYPRGFRASGPQCVPSMSRCLRVNSQDCGLKRSRWVKPAPRLPYAVSEQVVRSRVPIPCFQ